MRMGSELEKALARKERRLREESNDEFSDLSIKGKSKRDYAIENEKLKLRIQMLENLIADYGLFE